MESDPGRGLTPAAIDLLIVRPLPGSEFRGGHGHPPLKRGATIVSSLPVRVRERLEDF
jgi:hypothetical protein